MLRYADFPYRDLAISSHQANPVQWGIFRRPESRLSGRVVIGTFFISIVAPHAIHLFTPSASASARYREGEYSPSPGDY